MTIPIQPGPFSFLAGAGQAAGAIGGALTEADRYKQALALQQQAAAQRNLSFVAELVSKGAITPESLASPGTQGVFGAAGLPGLTPDQIEVPAATVIGRRTKTELAKIPEGTAQSQMAAGIPTSAATTVEEAKGAEAETAIRALGEIITPAQLRQYKNLLNPEAAEIAEKVFLERAQTELMNQDPQRLEGQMQAAIRKSVLQRLPRDPAFAKIADYAAIGGLGYLLQEMETSSRLTLGNRAQNSEKIRLVTSITQQSATSYRQALREWQDGLQIARRQAAGFETDPKKLTKILNDVDKDYVDRNPMPQYSDFLDSSLQEGGLSKNDFQEAFRSLVHVPGATADDPLQRVMQMYQSGQFTDADIDASTKLTASQKLQIKASKKKAP